MVSREPLLIWKHEILPRFVFATSIPGRFSNMAKNSNGKRRQREYAQEVEWVPVKSKRLSKGKLKMRPVMGNDTPSPEKRQSTSIRTPSPCSNPQSYFQDTLASPQRDSSHPCTPSPTKPKSPKKFQSPRKQSGKVPSSYLQWHQQN